MRCQGYFLNEVEFLLKKNKLNCFKYNNKTHLKFWKQNYKTKSRVQVKN